MTREEAIRILASSCIPGSKQTEALEALIPELAESEDERMLQEIIRGFENWKRNGKETFFFTNVDDILAYLEKQKDLDKMIVVSPEVWDNAITDAYENGKRDSEKQKEQKPILSDRDSTDFEIEVHEIIAQARNDSRLNDVDVLKQFEEEAAFALMLKANKLIEQKPAEWSEEDELMMKAIIGILDENDHPKLCSWLKSLKPQPKQGWSEEDERIREALVWHLKADVDFVSNGVTKAECLAYLDKQKAQKQEWNEEDEKVVKSIINYLSYDGTQAILTEEIDEWIAWLKSLRPSWKPSEEQMKALLNAEGKMRETKFIAIASKLAGLYEDLKKLKEE